MFLNSTHNLGKLGKNPPRLDKRTLQFKDYLKLTPKVPSTVIPPPPSRS